MEMKNAQRTRGSVTNALTMLCLLVDIQATGGILTQEPENTVAILGETATIKCISGNNTLVQWESFVNELNRQELWSGYLLIQKACPCNTCCSVDQKEPGRYSLNITARNDTAMHYTCTEAGFSNGVTATLIVIESNITCLEHLNFNDPLVCFIGVYGEWKPKMRWSRSDGLHINDTSASEWKNNMVTSTISMMQPMSKEISYTASLVFDDIDRPTVVTAKNIPNCTVQLTLFPFMGEEGSGDSDHPLKISLSVVPPVFILVTGTSGVIWYLHVYQKNKRAIQSKKSEAIEGGELPLQDNSM